MGKIGSILALFPQRSSCLFELLHRITALGGWMVENGWAVAFRRYTEIYVEQEAQARDKRVGLWSGEFQMPWEWRSSRRRSQVLPPAKLGPPIDIDMPG